jgi:hypothetical protein
MVHRVRPHGRTAVAGMVALIIGGFAVRGGLMAAPGTMVRFVKELSANLTSPQPHRTAVAAAVAPAMSYGGVTTKLVYAVDTTAESTLSVGSTGSAPGTQNPKQVVHIQGNLELTYVGDNAATGGRYLRAVMNGAPTIYQSDESGAMTVVNSDTSALQEVFLVEQASTGEVRNVAFKAMPSGIDAATQQNIQSARNVMKGAVSLLDMRLAAPGTVQNVSLTDSMGQYTAQVTQVSPTQIQVVKTGYTTLAPGVGIYEINGDVRTLSTRATLDVQGSSTLTLNAQNQVQSRHIDHETLMVKPLATSEDFSEPTDNNFTPSGMVQVTGDLTLQSVTTDSSAASFSIAPYTVQESLAVQCLCQPANSMQVVKANADIQAGVDALHKRPNSAEGPTLIARGIMQGGSIEPLRAFLKEPGLTPEMGEGLVAGLGMAPTGASRQLLRDVLVSKSTHPRVRRQTLDMIPGFPAVDAAMVDALEQISAKGGKDGEDARHALAVHVPRFRERDPERAERIVLELVDRVDHEANPSVRAQLLRDLASTRHERAEAVLKVNALDPEPAVAMAFQQGALKKAPVETQGLLGTSTSKDFCKQLDSGGAYSSYVSSDFKKCGDLFKKSAGTSWLGGDAWVGFGGGVTSDKNKGAFVLGGGLEAMLLKIPIGLFSAQYAALYDRQYPANRKLQYSYDTIWGSGKSGEISLNQSTPDDPRYPANAIPFGYVGKSWQVCGQVFVFTLCVEAGVGASYGLQYRFDGFGSSSSSGFYHEVGPYASITAWVEGSISFLCLKLSIELRGQFLNTSYPVRMDLDLNGAGPNTPNMCLAPRLEIVPWSLQLYGHFKYCFGHKTKLLWQESARPQETLYTPWCLQNSDLRISNITWDPSVDPDTSKPIVFNVTVQNTSQAQTLPAREVKVALSANGGSLGGFSVQAPSGVPRPLKGGESYTGRVVWAAPQAGNFTITATADANHDTAEANFADNTLSVPLTVKPALADIVVSSVKVITPATATTGATIEVLLANMGPGPDPKIAQDINYAMAPARRVSQLMPIGDGGGTGVVLVPAPIDVQVKVGNTILAENTVTLRTALRFTLPAAVGGTPLRLVDVTANADNGVVEKTLSNNTMSGVDVSRIDTNTPVAALAYGELVDRAKELHRWRATIQEDGTVDRLDWYLDGGLLISDRSVNNAGNLTKDFMLCVKDLTEAAHTIQVKAYDKSGKMGVSGIMSFTVAHPDLISPIVTLAPVVDLYPNLLLSATASDNKSGVDRVEFYMDRVLVGTSTVAPYTLTLPNTDAISMGNHLFTARAVDKSGVEPGAGGVGNSSTSPTVSYDKTTLLKEVEPNGTIATANGTYSYTRLLQGTVPTTTDLDFWAVTVPAGKTLVIGGSPLRRVQICDAAGTVYADNRAVSTGNPDDPSGFLSWTNTTGVDTKMYLKVQGYYIYVEGLTMAKEGSGPAAQLSSGGGRMVWQGGAYLLEITFQ